MSPHCAQDGDCVLACTLLGWQGYHIAAFPALKRGAASCAAGVYSAQALNTCGVTAVLLPLPAHSWAQLAAHQAAVPGN